MCAFRTYEATKLIAVSTVEDLIDGTAPPSLRVRTVIGASLKNALIGAAEYKEMQAIDNARLRDDGDGTYFTCDILRPFFVQVQLFQPCRVKLSRYRYGEQKHSEQNISWESLSLYIYIFYTIGQSMMYMLYLYFRERPATRPFSFTGPWKSYDTYHGNLLSHHMVKFSVRSVQGNAVRSNIHRFMPNHY